MIVSWSKSGNPKFGDANVRIPYDFQVTKKRAFLITKTIDFDRFFCRNPKILDLDRKLYDFHVKNNDFATWRPIFVRQFYVFATLMSGKHCKTTISRNFRSTVQRFCNIKTIFVRQFYVFATLMSEKHCKTTISRPKCATVLRFWNTDVRKTL